MEASFRPTLLALTAIFKTASSSWVADAFHRISVPRREPISDEFPVIKTHRTRGLP
jgi:hypothetical protein